MPIYRPRTGLALAAIAFTMLLAEKQVQADSIHSPGVQLGDSAFDKIEPLGLAEHEAAKDLPRPVPQTDNPSLPPLPSSPAPQSHRGHCSFEHGNAGNSSSSAPSDVLPHVSVSPPMRADLLLPQSGHVRSFPVSSIPLRPPRTD